MRGSLLQAGALPNSQPPTPGHMAAAGDAAKVVLIDRYYKVKVSKQRAEHLLSSRVIGTAADPAKVSQACILHTAPLRRGFL